MMRRVFVGGGRVQAEEGQQRYTSRTTPHVTCVTRHAQNAKPTVSLSHRCTMEHHDATGVRGWRPRASGGRPASLHVTDDTARHLRYTSRAKREADDLLSHRCTMEHPVAPWSTTMRRVLPPRDRR